MNRIDSSRGSLMPTKSAIVTPVILSILTGLILALLVHFLGLLSLPIVFFLVAVFPWLASDPFRSYIWLIITWPFLELYVRISLPAGIPDLTYERLMVVFLIGILILDGFVNKKRQLKIGGLTFFAGIYFAAQVSTRVHVIFFGGPGVIDWNNLLSVSLVPIGMYWITKNALMSRQQLIGFLYALIWVSLLICFTGLIDQIIGSETSIFAPPPGVGIPATAFARYMDVPGGRAAGVMVNPGIYGSILGIGILACISYFHHATGGRAQIFLLVSTIILLFGVFASYTRQAWIAVAIPLSLTLLFLPDFRKKFLPIFLPITILLIIIWNTLVNSSLLQSRVLESENVDIRIVLSKLAWRLFLEKPLFGWGAGAMDSLGVTLLGETSHHTFLSMLVDGGLFLFLAFLVVVVYILFRIIQVYRNTERGSIERSAWITTSGFILIFLMSGFARDLRYFGFYNVMFWICAGVIDLLAEGYATKREVPERNLYNRSFQETVNSGK